MDFTGRASKLLVKLRYPALASEYSNRIFCFRLNSALIERFTVLLNVCKYPS